MQKEIFRRLLKRRVHSHKYDFGHVLIIGGSPGMVGAPLLAGKAALRIGAGLVTIASQKEVTDKLERRVEETMTLPLPVKNPEKAILKFIADRKVNAVVIGPGLNPASWVTKLVPTLNLSIILDAGGLATFQGHLHLLKRFAGPIPAILTPHYGEFEKLVGKSLPKGRVKLKSLARDFAKKYSVILVLKGNRTIVASPSGEIYENTTGNPGLATAGTGDVLAGMIAGLVAQGIDALEAAKTAVYLHGLAADLIVKEKTQAGLIASDVIDFIPAAIKNSTT